MAVLLAIFAGAAAGAAPLDGGALYRENCARCHGSGGLGDGPDAALFVSPPRNLRDGVLEARPTAEVVTFVLDGRAKPLAFDLPTLRARAVDTASVVAYLQRLPDVDWKTVDPGRTLFSERCVPCHGTYGHPPAALPSGVRPPRDLADPAFQRETSDEEMAIVVRHGRAGMPALTPRLSEAEARQVAAFVRLLSPGYALYTQYCAACHGDHGVGAGSFGEAIPAPPVIFDRAYFTRHDPEQVQRSVWHMLENHQPSMPHFRGTISEAEARAIVEFLKKQPRSSNGSPPTPGGP